MNDAITDEASQRCPTPTAHKRVEEVHRFWHECAAGYQDPEEFRVKLNACIQAARNVTFAIQKEGNLIPGFGEWYSTWQEKMRSDPVMKWLHEARRRIVHEGDLETKSQAIVRLQIGYPDAAREVAEGLPQPFRKGVKEDSPQFDASPMATLDEILAEIDSVALPARIRRESTISIERRWVDSELPDMELLDVLAYAYGFLNQIIYSAHKRAGIDHGLMINVEGEGVPAPELQAEGGRLPCMVTSRAMRTVNFHLDKGTLATGGKMWSIKSDSDQEERIARKYGLHNVVQAETEPTSLVDLLPMYINIARIIAHTGEEHGWFTFFFRGMTPVGREALLARDAADKRNLAQRIAEIVAINRIDGIIEVGEVWQAPATPDSDGAFIRPAEHQERTEAILIWIETASGLKSAVTIPIKRRKHRKPIVGDATEINVETTTNNFLDPVRQVWATWPKTQAEP
jgi:hypothetical protein